MSKKQFEHIEEKFREAAENFRPPVTQDAWEKMEALLNDDGNKRRPAAIWWYGVFLLLITGGAVTYFYASDNHLSGITDKSTAPGKKETVIEHDERIKLNPAGSAALQHSEKGKQPNTQHRVESPASTRTLDDRAVLPAGSTKPAKSPAGVAKPYQFTDRDVATARDPGTIQEQQKRAGRYTGTNPPSRLADDKNNITATDTKITGTTATTTDKLTDDSAKKVADVQQNKTQQTAKQETAANPQQQLPPNHIANRFYFTASVASDGNAVRGSAIKQVTAMYGIGVGYQVNKRFSIQTGLYAGNKKYSADSNSYYLKSGYWQMVKVKNIDADCFIFNVPLSVRFNITSGRRGQFYGLAGISSYFMQKESYGYYYTYANSDSVRYRRELFGGNNHLLSVADFSIGYEHRLSRHFSLQGEPYLKLPLGGVGEGKVHLYSAGFMLGLKFRP